MNLYLSHSHVSGRRNQGDGLGGVQSVQRSRPMQSDAGSYLRLKDFVYHSTLGSRVIKKKKIKVNGSPPLVLSAETRGTGLAVFNLCDDLGL